MIPSFGKGFPGSAIRFTPGNSKFRAKEGQMDVSDGAIASDVWLKMMDMKDPAEVEKSLKALLAYCCLDTLAMVKILEKIKDQIEFDDFIK